MRKHAWLSRFIEDAPLPTWSFHYLWLFFLQISTDIFISCGCQFLLGLHWVCTLPNQMKILVKYIWYCNRGVGLITFCVFAGFFNCGLNNCFDCKMMHNSAARCKCFNFCFSLIYLCDKYKVIHGECKKYYRYGDGKCECTWMVSPGLWAGVISLQTTILTSSVCDWATIDPSTALCFCVQPQGSHSPISPYTTLLTLDSELDMHC